MPLDRGAIDQQLQAIGEGSRWWDVRELRDLPLVLRDDERILAIGRGRIARVRWLRRTWLVVATDQRLIFLRSFSSSGWRHLEVNVAHIERLSLRTGPFRGRLLVATSGSVHRVLLERDQAYRMHAALSELGAAGRLAPTGFAAGRMVRRMFDHVMALPAAAFSPNAVPPQIPARTQDTAELEQRVHQLEEQVQEMQEQIEFLEQLLRKRQLESGAGSL
jgi:hypothetical protein